LELIFFSILIYLNLFPPNFENMTISCYMRELRRYYFFIKFIPGLAPYKVHEKSNIITLSHSKFRRLMHIGSQLVNHANCLGMCYFMFSKTYDIFLTLFGLTLLFNNFATLLMRWNIDNSSKYINVFNEFAIFESKLKHNIKSNNQTPGNERKHELINM